VVGAFGGREVVCIAPARLCLYGRAQLQILHLGGVRVHFIFPQVRARRTDES
jgi:hypothetical protein